MPKFVGSQIEGAREIEKNAATPAGFVRLTYSQACLLPASQVVCSLDTTDRGSRGSLAKRWYRWFASEDHVLACPQSTANMLGRVAAGRARAQRILDALTRKNP